MDACPEDLRKKIVEAVERRAMIKSEVARLPGVSLTSVKRYVRKFRQGRAPSPGKARGKRPKVEELARRLLEADLKEWFFAKLLQRCEDLENRLASKQRNLLSFLPMGQAVENHLDGALQGPKREGSLSVLCSGVVGVAALLHNAGS